MKYQGLFQVFLLAICIFMYICIYTLVHPNPLWIRPNIPWVLHVFCAKTASIQTQWRAMSVVYLCTCGNPSWKRLAPVTQWETRCTVFERGTGISHDASMGLVYLPTWMADLRQIYTIDDHRWILRGYDWRTFYELRMFFCLSLKELGQNKIPQKKFQTHEVN